MSEGSETLNKILFEFDSEENLLQERLQKLQSERSKLLESHRLFIPLEFETVEETIRTKENALRRNKELRRVKHWNRNLFAYYKKRTQKYFQEKTWTKFQMSAQQLDYSFRGISYMTEIRDTRPRNGLKPYKRSPAGRFWCSSFRLNNNNIVTIQGITEIVQQIFEIPENLTWLDLSFNKLTYLHPEISELRNLKILYLHGNLFSEFIPALYHLQALDKLYSLTLHGNPVEEVRGYRQKVLFILPGLKNLDFTNVTNSDFENFDLAQKSGVGR